jgi:putative hemolysin
MEIFLLVTLILINGIFAMSEMALVTARRARLARLAEEGHPSAEVAMRLGEDPTTFLSTIQIGITSIGILNGIVGEAALAEPLARWLQGLGADPGVSAAGATVLVVVVVTYASIVIGELVPKRIAQHNPEGISLAVAQPMEGLAALSRPFVKFLALSTNGILRIFGIRDGMPAPITEDEIRSMLAEGSDAGIIEKSEHEMVRNVFRLDERQIASLMVPRADIVYLDVSQTLDENLERLIESEHSRFPVCRGGLHDILGVVGTKQLLNQMWKSGQLDPADLTAQLQPAVFVPESLTGMELLEQFRASSTQMVFVIDEYGEILGLVTLQDVLEAVTGEFPAQDSEESWAVQRDDGSWLLDGMIPIPELKDCLGLKAAPEENRGRYHTLSGMMMWLLGRLPRTTDVAEWENWRLEVMDLDGKRVDKVLASRLPGPAAREEVS